MAAHALAAAVFAVLPLYVVAPHALETGQSRQPERRDMRFRAMDRNADGMITRAEWRGSDQSFRVHDWNGDGVLSGDEVRRGAAREQRETDYDGQLRDEFHDWTAAAFRDLDHDNDRRITWEEWHYDRESFARVDRNRDGALSREEFLNAETDDDRGDRFDYLDVNRNGRVEESEWHGSEETFDWLDRDRDRVLSRTELVGEERAEPDLFASLDANRDDRITANEWHWSRRSFNQRDRDGNGVLSRDELAGTEPGSVGTAGRVFLVDATRRWTDTGIDLVAGDVIRIDADGNVTLSTNTQDAAGPAGSATGRRAPDAPLPDRPAGALIARIGNAAPIVVGQHGSVTSSVAGRLYLGVNDDYLLDNRGQFRVTITTR